MPKMPARVRFAVELKQGLSGTTQRKAKDNERRGGENRSESIRLLRRAIVSAVSECGKVGIHANR